MNPGEFVEAKKSYSIECFDGEDWYKVNRTHPDFAAAVAAMQALIQPKPTVPLAGVHPGVGLRWCGEDGPYRFIANEREYEVAADGWLTTNRTLAGCTIQTIFEAGRRYERDRGCAYVSDKPWTRQS
jgi:hypothetical protein